VLPEHFGYLLNVRLFVPVGMIVVLVVRRPWWQAALVAVAGSAAVELVQLVPALHRDASLSDVVTNGVGGLLGAGIAGALARRRPVGAPR
jgi:glycopeptide antibiotics resistance protein